MIERDNDRHGRGRLRTALAVAAVTAVVASMAIVGTVAAQPGQRFADVPRTHYAYESIEWAVTNEITQGCGDGRNFCPADTLNRAQMVTFLKRYHDKFHGTSTGSGGTGDNGDPEEYTLSGFGTDEESVRLSAGRYRVSFALEHDNPLVEDFTKIVLTVEDSSGARSRETVADSGAIAAGAVWDGVRTYRASGHTITVGDRLGELEPGRIYFHVSITTVSGKPSQAPNAEWEIVVTER